MLTYSLLSLSRRNSGKPIDQQMVDQQDHENLLFSRVLFFLWFSTSLRSSKFLFDFFFSIIIVSLSDHLHQIRSIPAIHLLLLTVKELLFLVEQFSAIVNVEIHTFPTMNLMERLRILQQIIRLYNV